MGVGVNNDGVGRQGGGQGDSLPPVFRPAGPAIFAQLLRQFGADWKVETCIGARAEQMILLLSAITQAVSITSGRPVAQIQAQVLDRLSRDGTFTAKVDSVLPY